ncbi:hypothetical protein WNY37_10405 [Henriciella sp. AS95]|uniref:hypothetical protein n=1 Tax=Henriciella sp. AS95 TaxID=3135782 RepID=UPI00317F96AC
MSCDQIAATAAIALSLSATLLIFRLYLLYEGAIMALMTGEIEDPGQRHCARGRAIQILNRGCRGRADRPHGCGQRPLRLPGVDTPGGEVSDREAVRTVEVSVLTHINLHPFASLGYILGRLVRLPIHAQAKLTKRS